MCPPPCPPSTLLRGAGQGLGISISRAPLCSQAGNQRLAEPRCSSDATIRQFSKMLRCKSKEVPQIADLVWQGRNISKLIYSTNMCLLVGGRWIDS